MRRLISGSVLLVLVAVGYLSAQVGPSALMMLPGVVDANYALKVIGVAGDFSSQVGPSALANLPGKVDASGALLVTMTGGTMSGHLLFAPDNTYDIGASGATRPRTIYVGTSVQAGSLLRVSDAGVIAFQNRANLISPVDGVLAVQNNAGTDFSRLQFGGATSSFPALKRSTTELHVRLADDSGLAGLRAGSLGYPSGAGGTVTQATSKATGVTLNTVTGEITVNAAALAADTSVSFTVTNSAIAAGDMVLVQHVSGGTVGSYTVTAVAAAGSASVTVRNITGGALAEAIVVKFVVFKAATS